MIISLSGNWLAKCDPDNKGISENWFLPSASGGPGWQTAKIPLSWNCIPEYERYEGVFWYATDFSIPENISSVEDELCIRFLAVNYHCRVWLNGSELGSHSGGYLPFEFSLPVKKLKKKNRLVARADNMRSPRRIPGDNFDWFNYGGIVRDILLEFRSSSHFEFTRVSSSINASGDAEISIDYSQTKPFAFAWKILKDGKTVVRGKQISSKSKDSLSAIIKSPSLWTPETPALYTLELAPADKSAAAGFSTRFGIREIRIDGTKILLNGKETKFRGVSLHEELVPYGRSIPREERFRDVKDIKALGFNALRTAHYTHDEALLDAADEIGLLVFEEIPVYWNLDYKNPGLRETARGMVSGMIARGFNHPCVTMWSVGNEVPVEDEECESLILSLMDHARKLDPTRPASYISCRFLIDKTRQSSDICCVNCYIGWYYGDQRSLAPLLEMTRITAPDKPWIITEFGACARHSFRSGRSEKYSEDRQDDFLSHYIRTINGLDWISGWFIWIYRDFRSPIRTHPRQAGFNRKGIVSEINEKKLIAAKFPAILEEKIESKMPVWLKSLIPVFEKLERFAYGAVMPFASASQKKLYDSFFEINKYSKKK